MRAISQDEINNVAWRACDTFRGTIDPSQYKDYILVMLFLKYVSDLVKERRADYEQRYGEDIERVRRAMTRERFVVPAGADFDSLYGACAADGSGAALK